MVKSFPIHTCPGNLSAGVSDDELKAIYKFLRTLKPVKNEVQHNWRKNRKPFLLPQFSYPLELLCTKQ